jgi:hypothetical protein
MTKTTRYFNRKASVLLALLAVVGLLIPALSLGQLQFDENVWVSYSDFRHVTDVAVGSNYVYIATGGGLLRWDLYKKLWDTPWVVVRGPETSVDLRGAVNVDYLQESNTVVVLTPRGAYQYNPTAQYWTTAQHEFASPNTGTNLNQAVFINSPGTTITGRSYFLQGGATIMDRELHNHPTEAFAADSWGFWWMGVFGVGVLQIDSRTWQGTMWEAGLFGPDVRALAYGDGWTILGGDNPNGGISFWKREEFLWDHLEPLYNASLQSGIVRDLTVSGRTALAATDFGVTQFDLRNGSGRTWRVVEGLWSDRTYGVAVDHDTAWVATENGVNTIILPKGLCKRLMVDGLKNVHGYRIAVDPQALWVGTDLGLFRMDRATGKGDYLGQDGGVGGPVSALYSGPEELWVGRATGLEVIRKQDLGQTGYPAEAFLSGARIFAVLPVDSLVYIGTDRGLWKYDRYRNRWHQYQKEDGLIGNHVYALLRDGDYLLIGTSEGVTRFYWNDQYRID